MSDWYTTFTTLASKLEGRFDLAKFNFKLRHHWLRPFEIQPYRGFGTANRLMLKGRVLEQQGVIGASESDSVWENILSMYRRFNSKEIPGARLRVRFQNDTFETVADEEGYFQVDFEPSEPLALERVWHEIELVLVAPDNPTPEPVRAVGHVLVPPPQATFGVISDIDDTIVRTGATDPLTMARIVVLNNPHTRIPFEGVAAFYTALRKGADGKGYNPIYYVSSSPWNLYDLLIDFMNIHGIPLGPLFLRDLGLEPDRLIKTGHAEHKLERIRLILDTHTTLPFVLIGDSGQEDPEIYRQVVREYPGRIRGVYIRDVSLGERDESVRLLSQELHDSGVEMVLVLDTVAAAEHAVQQGLIAASALPQIRADKSRDEEAPTLADQVPGLTTLTPKSD